MDAKSQSIVLLKTAFVLITDSEECEIADWIAEMSARAALHAIRPAGQTAGRGRASGQRTV